MLGESEFNLDEFLKLKGDLATLEMAVIVENSPETLPFYEEHISFEEEDTEILEPLYMDMRKVKQAWRLVYQYLEHYAESDKMKAVNKIDDILYKKCLDNLRQANITYFFH